VESPSQPFLLIAFKRPDQHHADDPVLDVLSGLLSSGRTGILYKDLVRDRRVSLAAGAIATLPSGKYPNLFTLYSVPAVGHTVAENEKAIEESLEKLKKEPVDAAALQRVKTKLRASVIRQLDSNPGLAEQLAFYHVNYGSWKKLFTGIEEIDKVTASDVQRVAKTYLISKTRTVAHTVNSASQEKAQ
jgi:predicted Zn-dependent peptidase